MKRKLFAILVSVATIGATATLALADHQIGGYFRVQGISENYLLSKDGQPDTYVDQRLRMKWTNTLNEFVAVTWFGEVDTTWGETSKGAIGNGGKVGADGVNVETKNAFLDLKLPNTPVSARLGIQGLGDLGLQSVYFNDDMAAAAFMASVGTVKITALWSKWDEGSQVTAGKDGAALVWDDANDDGIVDAGEIVPASTTSADRNSEDDTDLYGVQASFAATDALKFGAEAYWLNVNGSGVEADTADIYTLGVSGDMKFGPVGVDAFVAYQTGTDKGDVDVAALAASANASMKAGPADLALRVIYFGNDDDAEDDLSFNGGQGVLEFFKEGQTIFLTDVSKCNNNAAADRRALTDAAYAGYGLFAAVAKAGVTIDKFTVKGSVGYYMAMDDKRNDEAVASREGTSLGTEIDAEVSMKIADAATLSLRGAYALLGDFYDNTVEDENGDPTDPDDLYKVALMVNVPY